MERSRHLGQSLSMGLLLVLMSVSIIGLMAFGSNVLK